MKKIAILLFVLLLGILFFKIFLQPTPSVLLVVPNNFTGKLIVKESNEGKSPQGAALENYNDYVYEFENIEDSIVFVKNILPILKATEIGASKINISPLKVTIISKNSASKSVVVTILE